jgi:hypothetical protein
VVIRFQTDLLPYTTQTRRLASGRFNFEARISTSETNPKLEKNNARSPGWANCPAVISRFHRVEFSPFRPFEIASSFGLRLSDYSFLAWSYSAWVKVAAFVLAGS